MNYHISIFDFGRTSCSQACQHSLACNRRLWIIRIGCSSFLIDDVHIDWNEESERFDEIGAFAWNCSFYLKPFFHIQTFLALQMLIKTVQVKYAQNIACMRQNKIDAEFDSSSCLESRLHTAVNIVTVRAANVRNCVFGAAAAIGISQSKTTTE